MSRILTIYEALFNRKDRVCSKSDILEVLREYAKVLGKIHEENALWYLSRHGYIRRILFNFYYLNSLDERKRKFCTYEDKELLFMVLNMMKVRWYVGLNSALHLQGKIWQVPNTLTIINDRFSGRRIILGLKVRFVKIQKKLIFGLKEEKTKNKVPYFYSTLAKTYLDSSYLKESVKLVILKDTREYIQKYPSWLQRLT